MINGLNFFCGLLLGFVCGILLMIWIMKNDEEDL
jgi:hypothetical protein